MDTADRAVEIANEIQGVICGKETAAIYLAIGMVLGAMASKAERPNLSGLLEIVGRVANDEMHREMARH